ncbi:transketolase [Patescibacteria group bacterium]
MEIPKLGENLTQEHVNFLNAFTKSCRHSIIAMLKNSQSGHPGGSLSALDYLALLYTFVITQTGEKIVVSNGHISPAVYSTLAELKYIPKDEVIETFRKVGSVYEGHITRHVDGIDYGTGPLGIGVSVAAGKAWSEKHNKTGRNSYAVMGDGEAQEGQVHEMILFARKYELDNFIVFVDYNAVQLTDSLEETMPIDIPAVFAAGGWDVIDVDGHDFEQMWNALDKAHEKNGKPKVIVGRTIMGKGVPFMEDDGRHHKPTWHGKAPKPDECDEILKGLEVSDDERGLIEEFLTSVQWKPKPSEYPELLSDVDIDAGEPIVYPVDEVTDCRGAYGKALLDLAGRNEKIIATTADLRGSVMTKFVAAEYPQQHIEVGICEQHMISMAGGLSLMGHIPFASTFGAFLTSRPKDQARVNDINYTNVKMVATHCGLSVGEDGPTHQAIDDKGIMAGHLNTMVIEPADPNQTDRIIRYVASKYGNFYVRMGRHKYNPIAKEDGSPFYDADYKYEYGKCDVVREGSDLTIAASGACVIEALKAHEELKKNGISAEVVAVSVIKGFDKTAEESVKKTGKLITVEDHNPFNGLSAGLSKRLLHEGICPEKYEALAVTKYQLSGKPLELYEEAGISANHIVKTAKQILNG